jgi:hypothetical protein
LYTLGIFPFLFVYYHNFWTQRRIQMVCHIHRHIGDLEKTKSNHLQKISHFCDINLVLTRPVLDWFHDSGRQRWAMCKVMVITYNPSAKLILWVKFILAFFFWRQKQLFSGHTIGRILSVQILEVTFGKTQFSFLMTFFIRF